MYIFLDKNGDPVDMDDDNAFIADIKILNEPDADMMKPQKTAPTLKQEDIEALRVILEKGFEVLTMSIHQVIDEVAAAIDEMLEDEDIDIEDLDFDTESDGLGNVTVRMARYVAPKYSRIPP